MEEFITREKVIFKGTMYEAKNFVENAKILSDIGVEGQSWNNYKTWVIGNVIEGVVTITVTRTEQTTCSRCDDVILLNCSEFTIEDEKNVFMTWIPKTENEELKVIAQFTETEKGSGLYIRNEKEHYKKENVL